jgi:O-antigen ligase
MTNLKTEEIKTRLAQHKEVVSVLLLVLIASIHFPLRIHSPLFFLLCPLLFFYKEEVIAKKEFRILFYFFCSYLFIFTVLSQNISKSLVADFKVLKGIFLFPFAGLFFFLLKDIKSVLPHSLLLFLTVSSSFFFVREHIVPEEIYFSYFNHPNIGGFSLFFLIGLALFFWSLSKTKVEKSLNCATAITGVVLIVIANSRSIWLGLMTFALSWLFLAKTISRRWKFLLLFSLILGAALLFLYGDSKKPLESLAIRRVIWATTYNDTLTAHPWVGFGLNTFKGSFDKISHLAVMPHNSLVEIFQSTGFLGLGMMTVLFIGLFSVFYKIYLRQRQGENAPVVILSCAALIALLVISLFDFRFFDFKFMATLMVFMGLLNAVDVGSEAS